MKIRPEYQRLIDECYKVLPASRAVLMREKLELWSKYKDIQEDYLKRPGDLTKEEMLPRLSEKYNTSEKNIDRILYLD